MANAKHLVNGLLNYCGIESDSISDSEKVLLSIDSETVVFLAVEGNLIHLNGVLDEAPDSKGFYYSVLTENFRNTNDTGYYRYAIDPDSRSFIVSLTLNSDTLGQSEFIDYFKLFIENSEQWTVAINQETRGVSGERESEGPIQQSPAGLSHRV